MQALSLLGQQLSKIWQQLGLNQKVVIVISGLGVLAGLGALVFWTSRPSFALLYGRLSDPTEVGKMITALEEMKVPYKAGPGGTSIYVPQDQAAKVRMELMAKGMPKAEGVGFEIFEKPAFGMSDFQQQANYNRALQTELARSIIWIEGVEQARVQITRPENRLLIDPLKKAKAAVMLKLRGTASLPPNAVNSIRYLVANSVEGLKSNDVTVSDNSGNLLSEDAEEGSVAALASGNLNMRRSTEKYLAGKVKKMLETVVGIDQVTVEVSAEINTDAVSLTGEAYAPAAPAIAGLNLAGLAQSETTRTEDKRDVAPNPGGTPGTTINSNTDTNSPSFTATTNSFMKNDRTIQYAINRSSSNIVQMAGGLKSVSAAVFVNTNDNPVFHFVATNAPVGITNQLMLTTGILNNLSNAVAKALGTEFRLGIGQGTTVAIYGMSFNEKKAVEYKTLLDKSERTEWFWKIGRSLLYALLGIAAMVGFWKLVKTSSEELLPTGIPVGQLVGGQLVYETPVAQPGMMGMAMPGGAMGAMAEQKVEEAMGVEEEVEELQAAKSKLVMDFGLGQQAPERITIEVLKQLIRENPAKMSQAARSWMSRQAKGEEA